MIEEEVVPLKVAKHDNCKDTVGEVGADEKDALRYI